MTTESCVGGGSEEYLSDTTWELYVEKEQVATKEEVV